MDMENMRVITIEENSNDECKENSYSFTDVQILGYGTPRFIDINLNY
jgi:hypothetical protein